MSDSADSVTHAGIVEDTGPGRITVRVQDDSCNCGGCSISAICSGKSAESSLITVSPCPDAHLFRSGDRVTVTASPQSTLISTLWLTVIPTVILVAVVLTGAAFDWGIWAVIAGVGTVVVYDGLLFLFRRRLASQLKWKITIDPSEQK